MDKQAIEDKVCCGGGEQERVRLELYGGWLGIGRKC